MTDLVSPDRIERIVGVDRHPTDHYGRGVSAEKVFYILHSRQCVDGTPDLRDCPYSLALDRGLVAGWTEDQPARLAIEHGRLVAT